TGRYNQNSYLSLEVLEEVPEHHPKFLDTPIRFLRKYQSCNRSNRIQILTEYHRLYPSILKISFVQDRAFSQSQQIPLGIHSLSQPNHRASQTPLAILSQ